MKDLIDRNNLIEEIKNHKALFGDLSVEKVLWYIKTERSIVEETAEKAGEWLTRKVNFFSENVSTTCEPTVYECSLCGHRLAIFQHKTNYCPNCGKPMK